MNLQEQIDRIKNLMEVDWSKFDYENEHKPLEGKWSAEIDGEFYTGKVKELVKLSKKFPTEEIDINSIPDIPHHENPEDNIFIMKSSLDYPIILLVDNEMNIKRVLDGNHRVQKALYLGHNTIMAKLIPEDIIKQLMMGTINERYESRQEKLLNIINTAGLLQASLSVGGMERLINIVGEDNITKQNKIDFIKEVVMMTDNEYISVYDAGGDPIPVDEDKNGVLILIEVLYSVSVLLSIYEDEDEEVSDHDYIRYESLSYQIITEIFDVVVKYYNKIIK